MTNNENVTAAAILGGFLGMALAAPKVEDVQELQQSRLFKQQILTRKQKLSQLPDFIKLSSNKKYLNLFIEAYNAHLYGLFRSSSILCASLIESLLKEKFGNKRFEELINESKGQQLISSAEQQYLHGLRLDRNEFIHEIINDVNEENSILIMNITIRILNKLL